MGSSVHKLPIFAMASTCTVEICFHKIVIVNFRSVLDVIKRLPLNSFLHENML